MLRSINIRSFLIGGLLIFSVMCLVGAANNISFDCYGRFEILTNQDYAFILDSATGQVWSKYLPHEGAHIGTTPDEFHSPKISINDDIEVPE